MSDYSFPKIPPPSYGQQTSSLAVISLISGIASYFIVPLLGAIAAIITGNMAKKEIKQNPGLYTGLSMANWGVILGWVDIAFSIIGACFFILVMTGVFAIPLCLIPFFNGQ